MKNINNLFIFFVYDRPTVLKKCLETFFAGIKNQDFTKGSRSKFIFLLDGPNYTTEEVFLNFIADNGIEEKYEIEIINTENRGYSYRFFEALNLAILYNPSLLGFIETDYVYSENFMDTIFNAFWLAPKAIAVTGFSHPDFYNKDKSGTWFGQSVTEQYGEDIPNRDNIYKPFKIENLELQYATHSCCTFFIQWSRFLDKAKETGNLDNLYRIFDEVCERQGNFKPITPNDGMLTGGISLLWARMNGYNKDTKESAFIDVISPCTAMHCEGAGINGNYLPEGVSNCVPPKWNKG